MGPFFRMHAGVCSLLVVAGLAACGANDDSPGPDPQPDGAALRAEALDLGLSVRWASHNLGAEAPEQYGGYYGWGDPAGLHTTDEVYDAQRNWLPGLYGGPNPPEQIAGTELDVARAKWGGAWRLPTHAEIEELEACARQWTEVNGVGGFRLTGPNGNRIFLPAAGSRLDREVFDAGTAGYYWTGTSVSDSGAEDAYRLYLGEEGANTGPTQRYRGLSVRPVYDDGDRPSTANIKITAGGTVFSAVLEDNEAARAFAARLPLTVRMDELNGNEKYFYLDGSLPAAPAPAGTIHRGDLMLYGSNCVVLFYETFSSAYSYTRLGRVTDSAGLASALGTGGVTVSFER